MHKTIKSTLIALSLLGPWTPALASTATFSPGPCPVDLTDTGATVDCGVLQVPETRGNNNGRHVALPVVRVRAQGPDALPDPVIYLHGGPGGGVMDDLAEKLTDPRWQPLIGSNRDWLFFDQRGGGLSQPLLDCGQLGLSDTGFTSDADVVAASACAQRLTAAGILILADDMSPIVDYLGGGGDFAEGQLLAHFCKEELPFEDPIAMTRLADDDPLAQAVLANTQRLFESCKDWPVGTPNPTESTAVTSAVPTLLIAAEIDAGCPTDFSVAALPYLSAGQYAAVPNAVHDMASNSDCVMAMATRFLNEPLAPIATKCLAEEHSRIDFQLPEEQ